MLLGIKGLSIPTAVIVFMVTNIHWLWLPILWWTGSAALDKPARYLLTKAGMKDTGEKFGIHKDLDTAKAYFKKILDILLAFSLCLSTNDGINFMIT